MKVVLFLISFMLFQGVSLCQIVEDFESEAVGTTPDSFMPPWQGDVSRFLIVDESGDHQLRSNAGDLDASLNYYISTPSVAIYNASWEFFIDLKFNPSGRNFVDVYLTSDNSDLTETQNGYFVRIGDTKDWIAFQKVVDGTVSPPLIETSEDILDNSSSKPYKIKATVDDRGNWELAVDADVTGVFDVVGTVNDVDITVSSYFGLFIEQSSAASPANNHFFDDFLVTGGVVPDTDPPTIQSVRAISATEVDVQFSEAVGQTSETTSNYSIEEGIHVVSAALDDVNASLVHLGTASLTNGQSYTLTVNNIEDMNGNAILANSQQRFEYLNIESAGPGDIVINEFHASPNGGTAIPNAEFIELWNISDKFIDMENWSFSDASNTSGLFPSVILPPNGLLILSSTSTGSLFSAFGNVLEIPNFRELNNNGDQINLLDDLNQVIHRISYVESAPGISSELINPNSPCISEASYVASVDPTGGTPGRQNSVFDDAPDTIPPRITTFDFNLSLQINFSEVMDSTRLTTGTYLIDGLTIDEVIIDGEFPTSIQIAFAEPVKEGTIYSLTVSGMADCSGNLIEATTLQFGVGRPPGFNELIITEIFFDTDHLVGLPEREFIEVYNATEDLLTTDGLLLEDATSSITVPSFALSPKTYYVFTSTAGASEFLFNGLGIPSFPTLNNSGELLTLSLDRNLIFSVGYQPGWHDPNKADGGFSLEMKDIASPCLEAVNWGSSVAPIGGTPGLANSLQELIPDNFGPEIKGVVPIAADTIQVDFDENIDPGSLQTTQLSFDPSFTPREVLFNAREPQSFLIILDGTLSENVPVTLSINGVTDCSGNEVGENANVFALPSQAATGEIILNEVLFNPRPNGVDFVELYNTTEKYLSIKNWKLARTTDEALSDERLISDEELVMQPNEYLAITTDTEVLLSNYPNGDMDRFFETSSLPGFNDDGDRINLLDDLNQVIHRISYVESAPGISSELINPNSPCISEASYVASVDPTGGTPGRQNSVFDDAPDTIPPRITTFDFNLSLQINFSEVMDSTRLTTGTYLIDGLTIDEVIIDGEFPTSIQVAFAEPVKEGTIYSLTVSDITDCSGNLIEATTLQFGVGRPPGFNELIITEIFFDTDHLVGLPEREFIEVYNATEDLLTTDGLLLEDATASITVPSFTLSPKTYYVFTSTAGASEFLFNGIGIPSFPTLNNSGELLTLSLDRNLIFSVGYQPGWHDPNKADGGFSLEMKDIASPCLEAVNWGSSVAPIGGTPGLANSLQELVPDNFGPEIKGVVPIAADTIQVDFDENIDPGSLQTTQLSFDPSFTPREILFNAREPQSFLIILDGTLTENVPVTLSINGVTDCSGNEVGENANVFALPSQAATGEIILNEVLFNPRPNGVDFVELYNTTEKYLSIKNWKLARTTDEAISDERLISDEELVMQPNEYLAITTDTEVLLSNYPNGDMDRFFETSSLPGFNDDGDQINLLDDLNQVIHRISYVESAPGISSELINPNSPCISEASYVASVDPTGGTPGRQNSVFDDAPDTIPPRITTFDFNLSLQINFSEVMDSTRLTTGTYLIDGLTIDEVIIDGEFPTSIQVAFAEPVKEGTIYSLTVSGMADCSGNLIEATTLQFGVGRPPGFNELIITEIFFDTDHLVGLPEREFIEVYNATEDLLTTDGLLLEDATSSITVPSFTLSPKTYYVFTSTAGASEFLFNGIGIPSFPTLNNSGELLTLSLDRNLIFSVGYQPGWHDPNKADGGFSLEMKDIASPCLEAVNWGSSVAPIGGTPGLANSLQELVPDNFGPEIEGVVPIAADTIQVDFDENIDPGSLQTNQLSFDPSFTPREILFNAREPQSFLIILDGTLTENVPVTLSINGVTDCSGNEVGENANVFALPSQAATGEIILNEVLFNPRPNGVDFVELYNTTEKYLSIKNWKLARTTDETISDERIISDEELVMQPNEYLAITTDTEVLLSNYPNGDMDRFFETSSLPGFNDDGGTVVLLNGEGGQQELFRYEESFHYDLLESVEGVSLERISFSTRVDDPNNWRSASSTVGFATPGYENSQSISGIVPNGKVEIEPKVFVPGNTGSGRDFTTINYRFDQPGKFANVSIYDQTGRLVKNLAEGALLETTGFLRWDGTTTSGAVARLGYYIVLFEVYDTLGNSEIVKETVVVGRNF